MSSTAATLFHVTVLSNFARAFDKYLRLYRKSRISESTYPDEFYLLPSEQLDIGLAKAKRLAEKTGILGDRPVVLKAELDPAELRPNLRSGLGIIWPSGDLPVAEIWTIGKDGDLGKRWSFEETMAASLALQANRFLPFPQLKPRSLSFLPVARGCQAACSFCFSEASISSEQVSAKSDWPRIDNWIARAWRAGAERAVITGGGEPTLWPWQNLEELIRRCRYRFDKVVLITNGVRLAQMGRTDLTTELQALHDSGLTVLAVSRHHPVEAVNATLMGLTTDTPALLEVFDDHRDVLPDLRLRLICVLQRGGVASVKEVERYVGWAAANGVDEVCFKELYVSTSLESVYYSHDANRWSEEHQAPLSLVHKWAQNQGFALGSHLPWGSPVYEGEIGGRRIRVAAYTEPSLFWERTSGIARSWNIMADGSCYASLEDRGSLIDVAEVELA